jgi:hypothetical protein
VILGGKLDYEANISRYPAARISGIWRLASKQKEVTYYARL